MSADASASVASQGLSERPVPGGAAGDVAVPCYREACCQELPIRVLGSRAIAGVNGDILKGEPFEEESVTMVLFPRGAVIRLAAPVATGHDLMLIDLRSNRCVHCRIINVRISPEVKSYVELEFTHTASDFWGIAPAEERLRNTRAGLAANSAWAPPDAQVRMPAAEPTKALAAAAAAATPGPAVWSGYVVESPVAEPESTSSVSEEERENLSEAPFFAPGPMEALPLSEPVEAPAEAVPPVPGEKLWEAVSKPEPKRKRRRRAAIGAVIVSAIFFGYRITAPVETLPTAIETVSTTSVDVLPPGIAETAAAVKAGLVNKDWASGSTAAAQNSARTAEGQRVTPAATLPAGVHAPAAAMPETKSVEAPKRLVLPGGKMILPAQNIVLEAYSAPELTGASGERQGAAAPQLPGVAPGGESGLLAGARVAPPPPPEAAPAAESAARPAEEITPARLLVSVAPEYPLLAKQAHIEGDVTLEVKLDASGLVTGAKVLSGPQVLRAAAANAVMKWKFEPARLRGQATASSTAVTLRFRLR